MAGVADEEMLILFNSAANYMKHIANRLDGDRLLYLYSRFKQAKEGPCNITKPSFFDFQGKQKWEAWKKLGSMSRQQAMSEYVMEINRIDPDWESKLESDEEGQSGHGTGVSVSTMYHPDDDISEESKTIFDWCKECNVDRVQSLLANRGIDVNAKDAEGMALLHWAADRGFADMVVVLLRHKADPNVQDADDQTPLHYAASCGHVAVVEELLRYKAQVDITDSDGLFPSDMDACPEIQQLLANALGT